MSYLLLFFFLFGEKLTDENNSSYQFVIFLPQFDVLFFYYWLEVTDKWEFIHFDTHELDRILDYLDIMCCSILVYLCLSKIKVTTVSRSLVLYPTYSLSSLSGCCELLILRGLPYTLLYSSLPWSRVEVVTRSLLWLWTEVYTASLEQ